MIKGIYDRIKLDTDAVKTEQVDGNIISNETCGGE